MFLLLTVFVYIASATGDLSNVTQCQPSSCAARAGSCSPNSDCECLALSGRSGGICAASLLSCSSLTPCLSDNVTCTVSCTVCINSTRCNRPMCYPLALAAPQVCPPFNVSTTVSTTQTTTVTSSTTISSTTSSSRGSSSTTSTTTAYVPLVNQCTGATCANFSACSPVNPNCVCYMVSTGGGICGIGLGCSSLLPCDNRTLLCSNPQTVCILHSCCVTPVCFPLASAGDGICPTTNRNVTASTTTTTTSMIVSSSTTSSLTNSTYASAWTNTSTTFNRANMNAIFYYEPISMIVYVSGTYTIISSSNIDTYGYIYLNSFNRFNQSSNLITQDDDSGGYAQFKLTVSLQSYVTYVLVATTYSSGVTGPFTIIGLGPGRIIFNGTSTTSVPITSTSPTPPNNSCLSWNQNSIIIAGNGTAGNSTRLLYGPWDFSFDSYLNLYINDGSNNRIIKFANGSSVGVSLTNGSGNGLNRVWNPSGSVIDSYGNLYISDSYNYRIMRYSNITLASASPPIGGQVVAGGSYGSAYNQQSFSLGVAVDTRGNVFVSDYGNHRVMKWAPSSFSGILVAGIGNGTGGNGSSHLWCPLGIDIDRNGALYIADACNNRVQKWPQGSTTGITVAGANGQLGFPTDVSVDTSGDLYVLSNGGVYRFAVNSTVGTWVIQSYSSSYGFKLDLVGNIYIADYGMNVIRKFTVNSTRCGVSLASPSSLGSKAVALSATNSQAILDEAIATVRAPPREPSTSRA